VSAITFNFSMPNAREVIAGLAKCVSICECLATKLAPPKPALACGADLHPGVPHEEALAAEQRA